MATGMQSVPICETNRSRQKKAHPKVRLLETCTYTLSAKYLMVLTIWLV